MLEVDIKEKSFASANGETLQAVCDLNFQLDGGTFTCIVGPSGCGKTTTLRIILGLDKDFQGKVSLGQECRLAAVFQEPRLLPWRTVKENVELCLPKGLATDEKRSKLEPLYQILGLKELLDFYPNELSLGLARRVSIARAFAIEPSVLILDEPFVSLDEATADNLRNLLLETWQQRPTTVLMVTHNLEEAALLADNVLVMSNRPTRVLQQIDIDMPRAERETNSIQTIIKRINHAS